MKDKLVHGAGCFGGGLLFLVFWFISTGIVALIVQWLLSLFGVDVSFWTAFVVTFVVGFFLGGGR